MTIQRMPGSAITPGTITVTQLESSVANVINTGGGPKITAIAVTDNTYTNLDDTAVSVAGGYIKITGTGFVTGCSIIIGSVVATSVSFISSTEVRAQIPAQSAGTYTVYLVNPDGGVGIRVNGLNHSATPTWSTTSPLPSGVKDTAISIQLVATSNSAVTFSLQAGSTLPTGLTLSSGGLLSGTVSSISVSTTYNFTIIATDAENQDTPQAFQITISINDPYYELVTLHLPGTGTNLAQNNTFLDGSTNNFTITRNGNTTQGTFSPFSQTGWGNYFGSSTSYLKFASDAGFAIGAGNFSIECFVNLTAWSGNQRVCIQGQSGTTNIQIAKDSVSNDLFVDIQGTRVITYAWTPSVGQWYHIALVRSGTGTNQVTLYIDGSSVATGTSSASIAQNQLFIGGIDWASSYNIQGYISNFRYSNVARTITVPTSPYTSDANTLILTCQSNRFVDNSASPKTITVNGTTSVVAFSPFNPSASWSAATYGGSGYFDGSGDYLGFPVSSAFTLGTNDFTIEGWLYPNTLVSGVSTAFVLDSNAYPRVMWYYVGGVFTVHVSTTGAGWDITQTCSVLVNQWNHLVLQRNGNDFRTFLNGSLAATTTASLNIPAQRSVGYVGRGDGGSQIWNGYVSGLRVVNGTAVYNTSGFTPPTSPPTAITNTSLLLNFTNAGIYDATSKNDLETVGNAQISTAQSKWGGSSMAFDGTGDYLNGYNSGDLLYLSTTYTIEFWLRLNSVSGNQNLIVLSANNASNQGINCYTSGTSITVDDGNTGGTGPSGGTLAINTWYHVALVANGTNTKLFIDGNTISTYAGITRYTAGGSWKYITVGVNGAKNSNYLNGYINDLRITNATARYTANFTAPTGPFPTL